MENQKCFFHVDLDAFFASVEQLVHPEYRGKPVIISGDPHHKRNVVSTASYEARVFGVHSAMPSFKAYELCPQGIFVDCHMDLYSQYSKKVMDILKDFTPDFYQVGIDEAFLDMTGTQRLFGDPQEAALKLKDKVRHETGLTVSVGCASNAYLAKIASDINKPDGFFRILPGQEEQFMQTLPLSKIWGIGSKTQEKLQQSGLKTVSDIKKHSIQLLKTIIGDASSRFLYNAVRGIQPEGFLEPGRTHSLSNETTYEYDLYDKEIMHTGIMQLCHCVMFRLLENGLTGYTVHVKIRYEDFSTVNIQKTFDSPVLCTDDLYNYAVSLFDSKYTDGRGIRLIGVGVFNTLSKDKIIQKELFDFGSEKKQIIEKTILNLETKNPKIKIQKARLLNKTTILAAVFSLFCGLTAPSVWAAPDNPRSSEKTVDALENQGFKVNPEVLVRPGSTPTSLFSFSIKDSRIEFFADGFWNMNLKETFTATFGYGNPFIFTAGIPVFTQEIDMALWFMIDRHWYIQGAFADKFEKSTIAAGYTNGKLVKDFMISNRNITFPTSYSLTDINRGIGGGDNQAPGVMISLEDDQKKWKFDAAVRYDMLVFQDKTFYGHNMVSSTKISKESFMQSAVFYLPGENTVKDVCAVYTENSTGSYTDQAGRRYKKLSSNDYKIYPVKNQIIISTDSRTRTVNGVIPRILFEFSQDALNVLTPGILGTYGTAQTPGTQYLGRIQKFFGSSFETSPASQPLSVPDVTRYSYGAKNTESISYPDPSGARTDGFFIELNGKNCLLVQNSTGFSPFMAAFRYDGGTVSGKEVIVAYSSTEKKSTSYNATVTDDSDFTQSGIYSVKHTFFDVYKTQSNASLFDAENNFPFADTSPMTYLNRTSQSDLVLMTRSYSPVTRFDIGTRAVNGTVRVYKNSVLIDDITYSPQTGEVKIPSGINDSDKIYITWSEESSTFSNGAITGAAGYSYNITQNLNTDISASTSWALNPNLTYASYDNKQSGQATVSGRIKWDTDNIKLSNTTGVSLDIENVTDKYRLIGQNTPKSQTSYLTQDAAKNLPPAVVPSINSRPDELTVPTSLESRFNASVPKTTGSTDEAISGYKASVGWNFSGITGLAPSDNTLWAATTITMPSNRGQLQKGSRFELALKNADALAALNTNGKCKVYLQLGVCETEDFLTEDSPVIPTWCIYDRDRTALPDVEKGIDITNAGWQTICVLLRDEDRARISSSYSARIIVTTTVDTILPSSPAGEFYAGPYMLCTNNIYTSSEKNIILTQEQVKASGNNSNIFKQTEKYTDTVYWNIEDFNNAGTKISDPHFKIYSYFEETDISNYKALDLYFSYNAYGNKKETSLEPAIDDDGQGLTIILDRESTSSAPSYQKSVEIKIPADQLQNFISTDLSTEIHHLQIDRINNTVSIDGRQISHTYFYTNPQIKPSRLLVFANTSLVTSQTGNKSYLHEKGRFTLNEFFLSKSSPQIVLDNVTRASLKKEGNILTVKDFPLLKDASFNALGDFTGVFKTDKDLQNQFGVRAFADASATLATVKFAIQAARQNQSKYNISNAGHTIATTSQILKVLDFQENFMLNKEEKSVTKTNSAKLDFFRLKVPVSFQAKTNVKSDLWSVDQQAFSNMTASFGKPGVFVYGLKADISTKQKINELSNTKLEDDKISTDNYFEGYRDATLYQFSTGSAQANRRSISGNISNTLDFGIIGLKPQINFLTSGNYTSSNYSSFTDKIDFETIIPFSINRNNFSFKYQKTTGQVKITDKGGSYITDTQKTLKAFQERPWYFIAFPIYDLISSDLSDKVLSQTFSQIEQTSGDSITQKLYYSGLYEFSWKRPIFANKYDFFIPTTAALAVSRDIDSSINLTDIYQLKTTVGFTSFNIFSQSGAFPILKCFTQDEYTASIQYALKIPRTEPSSFRNTVNTYFQANFYVNQNDVLKTAAAFSFEDQNTWGLRLNASYSRKSSFTPILSFIKLFAKNADFSKIGLTRSDSLSIALNSALTSNSTNSKVTQNHTYQYNHQLDMALTSFATVYTGLDTSFNWVQDKICTITLSITLGGKLQF